MLTKNIYNKNNKQEKKILVFSNEKKSKWMKMHGMERLTRAKSECSMSKTQKFSKRNAKKLFIKRKKEKRFASLQTVVEGGVHGSSWWKSKKKKGLWCNQKGWGANEWRKDTASEQSIGATKAGVSREPLGAVRCRWHENALNVGFRESFVLLSWLQRGNEMKWVGLCRMVA